MARSLARARHGDVSEPAARSSQGPARHRPPRPVL